MFTIKVDIVAQEQWQPQQLLSYLAEGIFIKKFYEMF